MDIEKSIDTKVQLAKDRRILIWIILTVLVGFLIPDEIAFAMPDNKNKGWTTGAISSSGLADNSVTAVVIDGQGRVWVGTIGGLSVLAPDGVWTTYTTANSGLANDSVWAIAVDGQGRVWVGTIDGLSVLTPDGLWTTYTAANSGLAEDRVRHVTIDREGQFWVGTYGGGLSVLAPDGVWTTYTAANSGLADDRVRHVSIDVLGRVWVGTSGGGLSVLAPDGVWKTYKAANSGLADDKEASWPINQPKDQIWPAPQFVFIIAVIVLPVVVWAVQRQRSRLKKVVAPPPSAQTATSPDPVAALETRSTLESQEQRQLRVARLLSIYRQGDPAQRQQALAKLEEMGEVEEF